MFWTRYAGNRTPRPPSGCVRPAPRDGSYPLPFATPASLPLSAYHPLSPIVPPLSGFPLRNITAFHPCRHNPARLRGQLRRAAFGASAPASDAPETTGSKVVSGGPRNPHPGVSRTLRQPCPAGLSRPTRSLRSHERTSPAPVGRRGFGSHGIRDAADRLPYGRPVGAVCCRHLLNHKCRKDENR